MADLPKIKRNVSKMVEQGAPEADIDAYLTGEGVTPEQLRGVSAGFSPSVKGRPEMWSTGQQAIDTLTFGGSTKLNAAGAGALDATMNWAKGKGWNWSDAYNQNLEQERANKAAYNTEHPVLSGVGTGAGVVLGMGTLPSVGTGLTGAMGTGALYGGGAGALQDADSWSERFANTYKGARTGAGIGMLGFGVGKGLGWMGDKISGAYQSWSASPEMLGQQKLYDAAQRVGPQKVRERLDALGPDALAADVLGQRGTSMGRRAANLDPDARELISDTLLGRKAGQNERVVADMGRISGLAPGKPQTVENLVDAVDDQFRPELNRLYAQARQAGKDMPLQYFDDVLNTKFGKAVYNDAVEAVQARAQLNGTPTEISNLAIVDEMKKIFDSKATAAFASADKATGNLYADFAKNLRLRADSYMDMMDDPIYQEARSLAQEAYRAKDAITTGESLGARSVPVDLPPKVQGVDLANRQRVAQGYTAKKADALLNRGSTEGALTELSTPQGRLAADAALGPGNLEPTVARERTFNATARQMLGNSTTAQQLMEDGGMSMIPRVLSSPVGAVKDFAAQLVAKAATDKQRAMAPVVAKLLMSRAIPTSRPIPPTLMQNMLNASDEKAAKVLLLGWERESMTPKRREQISNALSED